ncbi:hypothetical protein [Bartonella sp. CM31XJBT]|uniref:hypothetical protein n=1 Tax=Bartonella sp. CM31XJBT TaxID=3019090 RepID=UPI0023613DA5|nr:hypothetical protein [Bartonella sp. CM31XJBT]
MFKSARLCVSITVIFFSQILEIHANCRRGGFPEEVFITIVAQEKGPLILAKNRDFIAISGQNPEDKENAIIRPTVKDSIFSAYFFSIGKFIFKTVGVLKRWVVNTISHTFEGLRDSYYH